MGITEEDIHYLIDFITKTLNENDELDPYDLDEAEYLLQVKNRLKEML